MSAGQDHRIEKNSEVRRSGIVAIAGRPNVGKSTLLNQFLGQKISIVTSKAQTTRQQVLGILTRGNCQVVFLDTPGLIEPHDRLQKYMVKASFKAVSGADLIIFIVEATEPDSLGNAEILKRLRKVDVPRLLAINKVDLVNKPELLPRIKEYAEYGLFEEIVPISAISGDGLESLLNAVTGRLPCGEFLYSEDQIATQPVRFFVAELIRETIFEMLHDELPYATTVQVEEYKERLDRKLYIRALIYTEKDSQKKIIIGHGGEQLKRIGQAARAKIEAFVEAKVYLELWVKVKEKWRKDDFLLNSLGFNSANL